MDDSDDDDNTLVLVCHSCQLTTCQSLNLRRRTICPHCGHIYSPTHQIPSAQEPTASKPESLPLSNQHRSLSARNVGLKVRNVSASQNFLNVNNGFVNGSNENDSRVRMVHRSTTELRKHSDSSSNRNQKTGPLQSITNFFKRLAPIDFKKRHKNKPTHVMRQPNSANSSNQIHLPPISAENNSFLHSPNLRSTQSTHDLERPNVNRSNNEKEKNGKNLADITINEIELMAKKAVVEEDWIEVRAFYSRIFSHSSNLVKATELKDVTKETKSYNTIDYEKIYKIFSVLASFPLEIQKDALKSIMQNILKDQRIQTKEELKGYAIFLLNPQFVTPSSYILYAHLLRQISVLKDSQHHYLVNCFQRVSKSQFKDAVDRIQKFLSFRLFPPEQNSLPPPHKTLWWIPSATKVIALLSASSNLSNPPILPYQNFYNHTLDKIDLFKEYVDWQNNRQRFSFCQYPFILSLSAKRSILQKDSEHQMVLMAKKSFVNRVQQRQTPEIGELFFNLTVRRNHLVSDSMNQISEKQSELKKKLKVTFLGEPGLDMGGLTKEWFMLLTRQILVPDFGLFKFLSETMVYWFTSGPCDNLQEFNLVGVLMGLAVYNGVILDLRFPPIVYKKLLSPAVVPADINAGSVGKIKPSINYLRQLHGSMANSLEDLLKYEGDVEEDFGITFEITYNELGSVNSYDLVQDGKNIPVTNKNREEYVRLYLDHLLNKSIYKQFQAFYHGFHSVCASNALILLRPEEVEALVCGKAKFEVSELKSIAVYEGYDAKSETIMHFWDVVTNMTKSHQRLLLSFVTGNDRVPVGGMKDITFKIIRVTNAEMLPVSHTCFNQLNLPDYRSKKTLKSKLTIAIQNSQGFGLE